MSRPCTVRQVATNEHSPPAFDVCTEAEAKALDKQEQEAENRRRSATDDITLSRPRDGSPASGDDASQDKDASGGNKKSQKK